MCDATGTCTATSLLPMVNFGAPPYPYRQVSFSRPVVAGLAMLVGLLPCARPPRHEQAASAATAPLLCWHRGVH